MSDQFCDRRVYAKKVTNKNPNAKQQYNQFEKIYAEYAQAVGVKQVDAAFKNKVDSFREFFEVPSFKRPGGLIKSQWIAYYKK